MFKYIMPIFAFSFCFQSNAQLGVSEKDSVDFFDDPEILPKLKVAIGLDYSAQLFGIGLETFPLIGYDTKISYSFMDKASIHYESNLWLPASKENPTIQYVFPKDLNVFGEYIIDVNKGNKKVIEDGARISRRYANSVSVRAGFNKFNKKLRKYPAQYNYDAVNGDTVLIVRGLNSNVLFIGSKYTIAQSFGSSQNGFKNTRWKTLEIYTDFGFSIASKLVVDRQVDTTAAYFSDIAEYKDGSGLFESPIYKNLTARVGIVRNANFKRNGNFFWNFGLEVRYLPSVIWDIPLTQNSNYRENLGSQVFQVRAFVGIGLGIIKPK